MVRLMGTHDSAGQGLPRRPSQWLRLYASMQEAQNQPTPLGT